MSPLRLAGIVLAAVAAASAAGAEPPACKRGGDPEAKAVAANFSYCLKLDLKADGRNEACQGLHMQLFQNDKKVLPNIKDGNSAYWEARIGADREGEAGKRRLVFLVQGEVRTKSANILEKYFTDQHYARDSFCKM